MRKQDYWLNLADAARIERTLFVAVCVFLNMQRDHAWIAYNLTLELAEVVHISDIAAPHIRGGDKIHP